MKTGIIIPCYNEAKRLDKKAFVDFIKNHDNYHLCFVNDGSKDNTLEVLKEMKSEVPSRISIVDVKKNSGKATAVRAGARFLYNLKSISFIGFIDADLSTDFRDFKDLVKTLKSENKLVVFGSRNSGGKGNIERNFLRNIFSKTIKKFILLILGMPIRDTQCGAKVFKRNIVPVVYNDAFVSRWLFDVEIFIRLKQYLGKENTLKNITEQPLMRWVHVDDSKLGVKDALQIPFKLLNIWITYNLPQNQTSKVIAMPLDFSYESNTPELSIAA